MNKKEISMALILSRRAGESLILSYKDDCDTTQQIRMLVRRIFQNDKTELQYSASCPFTICTFTSERKSSDYKVPGENMNASHSFEDFYFDGLIGLDGNIDISLNILHRSKTQVLFQINADKDVSILRDELVDIAQAY